MLGAGGAQSRDPKRLSRCAATWLQRAHHGNALNRALGLPDAYPFVIDEGVRTKLGFIHELVREQACAR